MNKSKDMPYHIGLEMRIYPSSEQKEIIAVNDGVSRSVYNKLVALNREAYSLKKQSVLCPVLQERLDYINEVKSSATSLKNAYPYMYGKLVDSDAVSNAIKNYKAAWNIFRKVPGTSVPTFHKKGYEQSYQTCCHYGKGKDTFNSGSIRFLDKNHIQLPIIGRIRFKCSYKMLERIAKHDLTQTRITTVTVKKDACDRYFVSLSIASSKPFFDSKHTGSAIGIDVNLTNLYTDSNGNVVENPKFRRKNKSKTAKAQRKASKRMARAKKEKRNIRTAKNYQKARKKAARLQSQSAAAMKDYLSVQVKNIVDNQDYIFVEDLKIKNLMKNHNLAFAIADVSWGTFFQLLEQKANVCGKTFAKVNPKFTTQTCHVCGHVCKGDGKIALGVEEWICPECGVLHIRDENAAINILEEGLKTLSLKTQE